YWFASRIPTLAFPSANRSDTLMICKVPLYGTALKARRQHATPNSRSLRSLPPLRRRNFSILFGRAHSNHSSSVIGITSAHENGLRKFIFRRPCVFVSEISLPVQRVDPAHQFPQRRGVQVLVAHVRNLAEDHRELVARQLALALLDVLRQRVL